MDDPFEILTSFSEPLSAHLARTKLESEGIEVQIQDENIVGINWLYSQAVGGVKLLVRTSELERAKELLAQAN